MIVCHCNVILKQDVRNAVCNILANDPSGLLEPEAIYCELQKDSRCCGCFPAVRSIVVEVLSEALDDIDAPSLTTTPR